MASSIGFWSYVRADDDAELGRISRLANDVVSQYELISGDTIELFLDTESIELGEDWRKAIQENLSSASFFIPVITPRYFRSNACVGELKEFSRGAKNLGVEELIIPLIYVNVPGFDDESSDNDLITLIKSFQYKDWRELRFLEVNSEDYRRGVSDLASRLYKINIQAENDKTKEQIEAAEHDIDANDDEPGTLEILAKYEEQISLLPHTLELITENIIQIAEIMHESTENIHRADSQGKSFASRLANTRRAAELMIAPTEVIWVNSNLYASQIDDIDQGFRIIIEQSTYEVENDPSTKSTICKNFRNIIKMTKAAQGAIENTNKMIVALEPLEKLSRDMRPVARKLKSGLVLLVDSTNVTNYWIELIEETGIDCEELNSDNS